MVPNYSPSKSKSYGYDKLLLECVGLPPVLDLAVHLVNFFGWMSQGGHSKPILLLALFRCDGISASNIIDFIDMMDTMDMVHMMDTRDTMDRWWT